MHVVYTGSACGLWVNVVRVQESLTSSLPQEGGTLRLEHSAYSLSHIGTSAGQHKQHTIAHTMSGYECHYHSGHHNRE